MKKKIIIFVVFVMADILLSVYIVTRPKSLGNMSDVSQEPETNSSSISFSAEENDRIKFSFKSNIKAGELDIVLYDSKGNAIYELDEARALETYYTFEKSDIYTLVAEYSEFVGEYSIVVYEDK